MIVCVCHNVSDKEVIHVVEYNGVKSLDELRDAMKVCGECECCQHELQDIITSRSA